MSIFFQNPPQPVQFWPPSPPPLPANFSRPQHWADKHFGQWCRNLSMDRHTQCPTGSPFHWYVCCGEGMAECCFGIQTWVIIMGGSLLAVIFAVLLFALWLGPEPTKCQTDSSREQQQWLQAGGCELGRNKTRQPAILRMAAAVGTETAKEKNNCDQHRQQNNSPLTVIMHEPPTP